MTTSHNLRFDGFVLPIILVLLVVITAIGVAISKITLSDQKFTGGISDYKRAFASAEAALSAGENFIGSKTDPFSPFNPSVINNHGHRLSGLFNGYHSIDDAIALNQVFNISSEALLKPSSDIANVSQQPVFIIDLISYSCQTTQPKAIFKVISRGWGGNLATVVTLQSTVSLTLNCGGNNLGSDSTIPT